MRKMLFLFISTLVFTAVIAPVSGQTDFATGPHFTFLELAIGNQSINTDSSIYDFNQENLLFNPSDLDTLDISLGMYWQRNNTLAYGMVLEQFNSSVITEDRFFEFENGSPILQEIALEKSFIGLNMLVTPFGAGERFGNHAWAPKDFVPYFRLGVGVLEWEYMESGDFVDYQTLEIFFDNFMASSTTVGVQVGLGMRIKISPRMDVQFDYTYTGAEDSMDGRDFQGFGDLDLSSETASIGLNIKFF